MDVLALIIAIVALVIAMLAYSRTGGIQSLRRQVDALSSSATSATETSREKAADALGKLERLVRGAEKPPDEKKEDEGSPTSPAS